MIGLQSSCILLSNLVCFTYLQKSYCISTHQPVSVHSDYDDSSVTATKFCTMHRSMHPASVSSRCLPGSLQIFIRQPSIVRPRQLRRQSQLPRSPHQPRPLLPLHLLNPTGLSSASTHLDRATRWLANSRWCHPAFAPPVHRPHTALIVQPRQSGRYS